MFPDRKSIIAKIKALLSKTTENGCTEAEAMMAAAKAASLMDQYELSADNLEAGQTTASSMHYTRHGFDHPISLCAGAIGLFTSTKIFRDCRVKTTVAHDLFGSRTTSREAGRHYAVVGLEHEVDIARYVFDICANALDTAAAKALLAENDERARHAEPLLMGGERAAWVKSFQQGMAVRMSETLREMAAERNGKVVQIVNAGARNALVTVRQDLIADWLKAEGITLSSTRRQSVGGSGFDAGKAAGAGVRFHSGMTNGQRAPLAIGGR